MNGVLFISEITQIILKEFKMKGINFSKFKSNFNFSSIQQEQAVNLGYKNLIFSAFEPLLPEKIIEKGPKDPLAQFNLAVGGKILEVSNQKFARAENLLSEYLPTFNPTLFGRQGKIMDSWETVRHNQAECDFLIFELAKESSIAYVSISTQFHLGNQAQFVKVEAYDIKSNNWIELISKTELDGHSIKNIISLNSTSVFSKIKVSNYPDGGITRLGLYTNNLPETEKQKFQPLEKASSISFSEATPIPKAQKPLTISYFPTPIEIEKNWKLLNPGDEYDVANLAYGGKILSVSNEHYGPAIQVISPFGPLHMFDGFESARSREPNHHEEILIQLAKLTTIHRIELDFSYFINNSPVMISILGLSDKKWLTLVEPTNVKAFAGTKKVFNISNHFNNSAIATKRANITNPAKHPNTTNTANISTLTQFQQIKLILTPDGGINRARVFTRN
jgi:allantoicase